MNRYRVLLKEGPGEVVEADSYHRDGDQYIFQRDGQNEVQFIKEEYVVGIFLEPNDGITGGGSF